jgi:trigger factor
MNDAVTTSVSELPDSRVRVQVRIEPGEIEGRMEREARQLAPRVKVPGFRRGKVPAPLVIQRLGREAVFEEAVRSSLSGWYASAIEATHIVPVGDPSVQLGEPPGQGEPFQFSIEVGVLPKATLGQYKGLEVARREPAVSEQEIDEEIGGLRDRLARLEDVDRKAEHGDFVVIDYTASVDGEILAGSEARDQLVELDTGRLLPSLEAGLLGLGAGDQRTIEGSFPQDYANDELAGRAASFDVTVKQVKRKQLPEVDEDFAADTGFDSIAELREDIARRLLAAENERVEREFREAALDAAAGEAHVEIPQALTEARAREIWERRLRALAEQGISRDTYLKVTGHSEDDLLAELAPVAEQALRREAVITAVVQAEGIRPDDQELLALLGSAASRSPGSERDDASTGEEHRHDEDRHRDTRPTADTRAAPEPEKLISELRRSGRLDELREELAAGKAVELIATDARPIPSERARAREKLWTPEKEAAEASERDPGSRGRPAPSPGAGGQRQAKKRLWTPRSSG